MYINPFVCGILATVLFELSAIFIYSLFAAKKK